MAKPAGAKGSAEERTGLLFDLGPSVPVPLAIQRPRHPIWTGNKAKLIERYLWLFVLITRHGTYIDGFSGPQEEKDLSDLWSARLVLTSKPQWLRHFYLFERHRLQLRRLREMLAAQPTVKGRDVRLIPGDFNEQLRTFLSARPIGDKEATFCLLDQRTFECDWASVELLANYKPPGSNRIELFYFLPNGWLPRAMAGLKKSKNETLTRWWGRPDWEKLVQASSNEERRAMFEARFKELGYAHVVSWPIYEKRNGGSIMYYMIHASDHAEAPVLMARAYNHALQRRHGQQRTIDELLAAFPGQRPATGTEG